MPGSGAGAAVGAQNTVACAGAQHQQSHAGAAVGAQQQLQNFVPYRGNQFGGSPTRGNTQALQLSQELTSARDHIDKLVDYGNREHQELLSVNGRLADLATFSSRETAAYEEAVRKATLSEQQCHHMVQRSDEERRGNSI